MTIKGRLHLSAAAIALAVFLTASPVPLNAQQGAPPAVNIGATDLGGVVTGPGGPEAGVWVIAETTDLPTRYIKSVVTDDQGRYLIPDLPRASYQVWVRGYGLVDSAKVRSEPGKVVNFTATAAPNAKAAAEVYPSIYWYSMLKVPPKHEFPVGSVKTQAEWLNVVKTNGCFTCHALGNKATRTIPPEFGDMKSEDAWARRILSGQAMTNMATNIGRMHAPQAIKLFADWTDRIAAGELPAAQPRRPQGRERNVVITQWDFSEPQFYLHDVISTDKRKPTVNANGLVYGATEESTDFVPIVDPVNHRALQVKMPVRDPKTRSSKENARQPSAYWGDEVIWDSQASMHNPMMDEKGQVWFTSRVGPPANPDFCKKGSEHPSAKVFPVNESGRHLSMLDPKTGKITLIRTCYPTHHLVFAEDANNTLWMSAGGPQSGVLGWLDRKKFEETGDEQASQGWTPIVIDTNGNGKRDEWVEPNQPVDPAKDKRIVGALYGIGVNPQDGTIWGSVLTFPGYIIRVNPGPNPTRDGARRDLRAAGARLWAARLRHRPQRRRLGAAGERPHGELRPPQVQGTAQRPGQRDRAPLSGRLDAHPVPRPAAAERDGHRQRGGELLHLGRPVRHVRAGPRRGLGHRQRQRVADGAGRRPMAQLRRPLPARLLRQVDGRPHRRSERRLEGQGRVGDLRHAHAVPSRDRQGLAAEGGEIPAAPRSAGAVSAGEAGTADMQMHRPAPCPSAGRCGFEGAPAPRAQP